MKISLLLLGLAFPLLLQAQIYEDFTNDGYPHDLQWRGHPLAFGINAEAQLQSQTISTTYISTENRLASGVVWEIGIRLDFRPSPTNQLRTYLVADRDTLTGPLNGYFIEIGENGSTDRYHLYRQDGEHTELLMSSPPIERADPAMINDRIRVIRDMEGDWQLQLAIDNDEGFTAVASVRDTTFRHTAFFGFLCRFTRANSDKFFFDYFSIDTTSVDVPVLPPSESKLLPDDIDTVIFYDDFSVGIQQHWQGDTAAFSVRGQRLKLVENAPSPVSVTVENSRIANTVWEAGIQVNGMLSSGNYVRLYLAMTDTSMENHTGYHLQIDGTKGQHIYHIWRQRGSSRSRIFQSDPIPNRDDRFRARVRVICDFEGRWQVLTDEYDSGIFRPVPSEDGKNSVIDRPSAESGYAGFFVDFSKTRWRDYSFDYLLIKSADPAVDSIPDTDSIAPAQPYDVIFNEMMVNPNGVAGLPSVEYVELYNPTNDTIVLDGWTYKSKTRTAVIPKSKIAPNGYLLLYPAGNPAVFDDYGEAIELSPWPSLVNNGTALTLQDPFGTVVDQVSYTSSWYRDTKKKNGGWSLERITPYAPCLDTANWMASTDSRGGTPGIQNSVYNPNFTVDFEWIDFAVRNSTQLLLTYSHKLDTRTAISVDNYWLNNGSGKPARVQLVDSYSVLLQYDHALPTGREYTLAASGVTNCTGLSLDAQRSFFIPDTAVADDILINEILFNPKSKGMEHAETDGVDFVEIYNHSSKTVDLQQFYLAHVNHEGKVAGHRQVSAVQRLFRPGEYKVLTSQPHIVKAHYPQAESSAFIQMVSLPRFNNDAGTALLIGHGQTIDSLTYYESMHAPFIDNHKGISLERKSFNTPTNAPGNFYSAATSAGGATPGYRNSQGAAEAGALGIHLASKTFSPDDDGFEDALEINYHFAESGNMATILIYDSHGRLVRRLQRNQSMAREGTITWDGRSDTNQQLPVGIYVALIEVYNDRGMRQVYRKSFALAAKL